MQNEKLFKVIDDLYQTYLDVLEDVCNIESPTDDKAGVDECGRYFIEFAKKKGWKVEVVPQAVSGDLVFITMNPDAKGVPVTLSGHIDTVHPKGLFGYPPVKRDEKYMYGPGVVDCKGGVVGALYAMDALERCGFNERPVMLLIQSDEEKGSKPSNYETIHTICEKAVGSTAFLNLEGMDIGKVVVARKGIMRYLLTVTGVDIHSSLCYNGANSITEAAHKIIELERFKDKDGITMNCGTIKGGTVANTVAKECSFTVDIRYSTAAQLEEAKRAVYAAAEKVHVEGTSCVVSEVSYRPAMVAEKANYELVDRMNAIFEKCGMPKLEAHKAMGGSDAAYSTEYGIPSIDNVGTAGGYIHTEKEYAIMESLRISAKILAVSAAYL